MKNPPKGTHVGLANGRAYLWWVGIIRELDSLMAAAGRSGKLTDAERERYVGGCDRVIGFMNGMHEVTDYPTLLDTFDAMFPIKEGGAK